MPIILDGDLGITTPSPVVLNGSSSGTISLVAPAVAGTNTITFPATTATIDAFPSGTRLNFQQTASPTGWTKDTSAALDDSIMRIVTGTASSGGTTAFTTFNGQTATQAFTLTSNEIPSHLHVGTSSTSTATVSTVLTGTTVARSGTSNTGSTGGGAAHSHGITTDIKYRDFIIASKN